MKPYFEKTFTDFVTDEAFPMNSNIRLQHYPKLYKYRSCENEYNFEMIEQGYLWADYPHTFLDPSDSIINNKLLSEEKDITKWLWKHFAEIMYYLLPPQGMQKQKQGQTLQNYIDAQKQFSDSKGRFSAKRAKVILTTELNKLSQENKHIVLSILDYLDSTEYEDETFPVITDLLAGIMNSLRNEYKVCCLTARKDNQKMWEEYAAKYSGFVIEYDFSKSSPEWFSIIGSIFPVEYYKRLPKVPFLPFIEASFYEALYKKNIDISDAMKKLYKQLLCKKFDYRAEEEWRIISDESKISFPFISSIYAGYKITDKDFAKLKDLCTTKNIPLYKQKISPINGNIGFELVDW